MVKTFFKTLVIVIGFILFTFIATFPPFGFAFADELLEVLLSSKTIWFLALFLTLNQMENKKATTRKNKKITTVVTPYEILKGSQYESEEPDSDDDNILSPLKRKYEVQNISDWLGCILLGILHFWYHFRTLACKS